MRTSELVGLLASQPPPRRLDSPRWRFTMATLGGVAAATLLMVLSMRLRADLSAAIALPMFWGKLLFTVGMAALALVLASRLAVPGAALGGLVFALPLPILSAWAMAGQELAAAPPTERLAIVLGQTWVVCPVLVATLAAPVFVATIWALRGLAPTRLRLAGAMAGLFSGAAGAAVYCLHCPEMAAAFVSTWYLLGMLVPAGVGALLGPRLLRW